VEHCGGAHEGNFVHSLTLTDMHSGWTRMRRAGGARENPVVEAICMIRRQLPFALRGLDTTATAAFVPALARTADGALLVRACDGGLLPE